MWYKEATSMGMYIESITKRIGQIAIEEIKKKELSSVSFSISIVAAINNTQIPQNIKTNLTEAFESLDVINIHLIASQLLTKSIRMAGGEIRWKNGRFVIQINVEFNSKTTQDFKTILQDIYEGICPVIRHELEHFVQNQRINSRDKSKINKPGHDYKNYTPIDRNPYGYYMNKQEVEGHVTQLYMKAKNARKPFETVLREFVDTQAYRVLYNEAYEDFVLTYAPQVLENFAQTTARKQAEDIYNTYLRYAKSRYPNISDIKANESSNIHAR